MEAYKTESINIRVTPELKKLLKREADKDCRSLTSYITKVLKEIHNVK